MEEWSSQIKEMLDKAFLKASEAEKSRLKQIVSKLEAFKGKNNVEIYTANDYDQMWRNELDPQEVAHFDEIVLNFYNDVPVGQANDQLIQQQPQRQLPSPSDIQSDFDTSYLQYLVRHNKQDIEVAYRTERKSFRETLQKKIQADQLREQDELYLRYEIFNKVFLIYAKLYNYVKLQNVKPTKKETTYKYLQRIVKLFKEPYQNQQQTINNLVRIIPKYFYRYGKHKMENGESRTIKVSLKQLLIQQLKIVLSEDKIDWMNNKTNLKDLIKQAYDVLKQETNDTKLKFYFTIYKNLKIVILDHWKLRSLCHSVSLACTLDIRSAQEADKIMSRMFTILAKAQASTAKINFASLVTEIQNDLFKQPIENKQEFDNTVFRQVQNSKKVSEHIISYWNRIINKGLEIIIETQNQQNQRTLSKPFTVSQYEELMAQDQNIFACSGDTMNDDVLITQMNGISKTREQQADEINEGKQQLFKWYDFLNRKLGPLSDDAKHIQDLKARKDVISEILQIFNTNQTWTSFRDNLNKIIQQSPSQAREYIEKIRQRVLFEIQLYQHVREFVILIINYFENTSKSSYQSMREILKSHMKLVLHDPQVQEITVSVSYENITEQKVPLNSLFYNPTLLLFHQFPPNNSSPNQKMGHQIIELIEKFRLSCVGILGIPIWSQDDKRAKIKQIRETCCKLDRNVHDIIMPYHNLEIQYAIAQNIYRYACSDYLTWHRQINKPNNSLHTTWDDPFPINLKGPNQTVNLAQMASDQFCWAASLAQTMLCQRFDLFFYKRLEHISKLIKQLQLAKFTSSDLQNNLGESQKHITDFFKNFEDPKRYKQILIKEVRFYEMKKDERYRKYSHDLSIIFQNWHSKGLVDKVLLKKLELRLNVTTRDEIASLVKICIQEKLQENNDKYPNMKDRNPELQKFVEYAHHHSTDTNGESNIWKDTKVKVELYANQIQDKVLQSFLQDLIILIDNKLNSQIQHRPQPQQQPQIVNQVQNQQQPPQISQPVFRPQPIKRDLYLNVDILQKKMNTLRQKTGAQYTDDEAKLIIEVISDKFSVYMKTFLGKVFREAICQNAGDEFKVYQAPLGQPLIDDKNSEVKIKQITDLFNNYGPKKDGDHGTHLLVTAEQHQIQTVKPGSFTLADLTPIARQKDFNELLVKYDQCEEDLLRNQIKTKKWRSERPQYQDVLTKKIKRGTDLGEAIQQFFTQRIMVDKQANDSDGEQDPVDETAKIKQSMVSHHRSAVDHSQLNSKIQLQIKLKNLEQNNHMSKRREISVKTVQSVLEQMAFYRRSNLLSKSYLF